jgi:hypothetical protein
VVARSVVGRYLVAAFAFLAAAVWLGVSLKSGFTCLLVFVLAFQAVRLYQRRSDSRRRRPRSTRERPSLYEPARAEETIVSSPAPSRRVRPQPSDAIYDGDREDAGWPVASEATW